MGFTLGNPTGGPASGPPGTRNNPVLMQWGDMQFQVYPLNIHEYDHETATDWAHKEIAGAAIYREWVGENDEILYFRGRLFPYRIGGIANVNKLDDYRRAGMSHQMIRGSSPGEIMGWFVCEKLVRAHTWLSVEGVGQVINFEAVFARVPTPEPAQYLNRLWRVGGMK